MEKPTQIPEAVKVALERWAKFHKHSIPELSWDGLMGCYYFVANGIFHGVELDGHIHT